ncbi:MAG: hypothetical protein QGH39_06860 [Candidatus Thermoplasmatota archaeon]|jgi:hypothetical protein|nr:hypothetical protein [Candidatus Thermoplasmatota archaeon]MDP7265264.1 hypothetical protein [Candidatus Thermoplasmatota archaeon]
MASIASSTVLLGLAFHPVYQGANIQLYLTPSLSVARFIFLMRAFGELIRIDNKNNSIDLNC